MIAMVGLLVLNIVLLLEQRTLRALLEVHREKLSEALGGAQASNAVSSANSKVLVGAGIITEADMKRLVHEASAFFDRLREEKSHE
jgi:hypothetical protein